MKWASPQTGRPLEAQEYGEQSAIKIHCMPAHGLLIVALFVLALRLPFLNQAVQGDDVYYLAEAQHAQISAPS